MSEQNEVIPQPAATLIILRGSQVLMGMRSKKHIFMPNVYVFPGGRLDDDDCSMQPRHRLAALQLERYC